jgi:membrane protease YdiL (CAAX protease family)
MNMHNGTKDTTGSNWRHVGVFLGLTFGLTWLLDLAVYLRGGLGIPGIGIFTQLQTLLPAFSAMLLGLFFFAESPIYRTRPGVRGRWFFYYFLAMTLIYALAAMDVYLAPAQRTITIINASLQVLTILGLFLLIVLRFVAGRPAMSRLWLSWGSVRYWLFFGLGLIIFYVVQAALNALSGLGGTGSVPSAVNSPILLILAGGQSVLLAPLLFILVFLGEEYGWRGFLQNELSRLGRVRGVLLVGLIWGAWHWPIILMGANYPGHPLLGLLLMTLYSAANAVVLGYAVLKSGSVLLAAYLHGIIDQVINFIVALGFRPNDPAFSFGIGLYGIVMLALLALLIFRDPLWREKGSNLE